MCKTHHMEQGGLLTSNLANRWSTVTHITDMCSDLKGQSYNVKVAIFFDIEYLRNDKR